LWLASVMPVGLCVAKRFVAGISDPSHNPDPSHNRQAERSRYNYFLSSCFPEQDFRHTVTRRIVPPEVRLGRTFVTNEIVIANDVRQLPPPRSELEAGPR